MGIFLILLASFCFVLSTYYGKLVSNYTEMSAVVTSFARYILGVIGLGTFMYYKKISFKPVNSRPIIIRSILNATALIMLTASLNYTTITNANMIHLTYPVFVFIFARYTTGEKLKHKSFFYIILVLVGSYIVSNPDLDNINIGDLIAFLSAISAGVSVLYLTESRKSESSLIILFYLMLIGTIINFPLAAKDLKYLSIDTAGIVLLAAGMGFLGQYFTTEGFKYVDSATGSILASSRMIMATIIGYFWLNEPINLRIISGLIIIFTSLIGVSGFSKTIINKFKKV